MKYHFSVYIEELESDAPRNDTINNGIENSLAQWILEGVNKHCPLSHRDVDVQFKGIVED